MDGLLDEYDLEGRKCHGLLILEIFLGNLTYTSILANASKCYR